MAAAVVKLNTLANAVGPASQDEHLLVRAGCALAAAVVAAVHVGRVGLKLSGTRVHTLVAGEHTQGLAVAANLGGGEGCGAGGGGRRGACEAECCALHRGLLLFPSPPPPASPLAMCQHCTALHRPSCACKCVPAPQLPLPPPPSSCISHSTRCPPPPLLPFLPPPHTSIILLPTYCLHSTQCPLHLSPHPPPPHTSIIYCPHSAQWPGPPNTNSKP